MPEPDPKPQRGEAYCPRCGRLDAPTEIDRDGVEVYRTHHAEGGEKTCYLSKGKPVSRAR